MVQNTFSLYTINTSCFLFCLFFIPLSFAGRVVRISTGLKGKNCVCICICICIYLFIYLFTTHYKLHDYNYKKIQKCRKKWQGGLKETLKLMLIRPPRLQFFKDGIKITATDTNYYQKEIKVTISVKEVYKC